MIFANALASIHFMKYSKATVAKRRFPGAVGSGPTISTPPSLQGPCWDDLFGQVGWGSLLLGEHLTIFAAAN